MSEDYSSVKELPEGRGRAFLSLKQKGWQSTWALKQGI